MRVKCYSVRLESLVSISDKALKATAFDGSKEIIPKSQVYGRDWDVITSEAWWISVWILEKKNLQYSCKKMAVFDTDKDRMVSTITVRKHKPEKINELSDNIVDELRK